MLSDLGLTLVCVQSGREALRAVLNHDFAAILLDVNMPIMDGFETAALIRQRQNSQSTPIIFITSYGDDPFISRGYALGAVDYLLTPVVPAVLRTKVMVFAELYRKTLVVRRQAEKLQQRANQLAALAAEVAEVEQRERRRLAQILHDNLQQLLVAARFRIGAFNIAGPDEQASIVAEIDNLLNQSIEASRALTAELSPPILHDAGLHAAIEWLARRMQKNQGFNVEVRCLADVDFATDNLRSFVFNAVRELLFNCFKHAGVNEARVILSRCQDDFVQVTVTDAGNGFDPAILEASAMDGDHFGLFSIRERATLMHGHLDVISAPGRGTTIVLKMPNRVEPSDPLFESAATALPRQNHTPTPPKPGNGSPGTDAPIRVIIADDHEIIRKGLVAFLENQGGIDVVGEAGDGLTAVELTRSVQPHVVIMDVSMPGMNGVEATRVIKRENPDVRVIGLSLHKREDMGSAMMLAGASSYLSKSGPPESLVAAIRETPSPAESGPGNGRFAAQPEMA